MLKGTEKLKALREAAAHKDALGLDIDAAKAAGDLDLAHRLEVARSRYTKLTNRHIFGPKEAVA